MSVVMADSNGGYTIIGAAPENSIDLPVRLSKSLSIRREPKFSGNNLRILYHDNSPILETSPQSDLDHSTASPHTPVLPLTPPAAADDPQDASPNDPSSTPDTTKVRSLLVTPVNQYSPPTPDRTPPRERTRPFLEAQPSMASTRAESFKTAQEDLFSDQEPDIPASHTRSVVKHKLSPILPFSSTSPNHKPSPLARAITPEITEQSSTASTPDPPSLRRDIPKGRENILKVEEVPFEESPTLPQQVFGPTTLARNEVRTTNSEAVSTPGSQRVVSRKEGTRRGPSLRERLEESRTLPRSPSVDKFASIIGWTEGLHKEDESNKRWSSSSTTSNLVNVVEKCNVSRTRGTLRHVSKNDSLRSASSPLPASNRTSLQTTSTSPHRLVHKKARLSNVNRWSFGSEATRPMSISSNTQTPKIEVIKVAVIPERGSSLQGSTTSSRRHSRSLSAASATVHLHRSSGNHESPSIRKRTGSESIDRGRDRYYPPQVPPQVPIRSSSLSAPTSRSTSRANSITSDKLRSQRKQAEKDLRTTLERMESERLVSSSNSFSVDSASQHAVQTGDSARPRRVSIHHEVTWSDPQLAPPLYISFSDTRAQDFVPDVKTYPEHYVSGTRDWATLRPTMMGTPLSMPSFMSASPEISEAKAINFFPHNNHSVQLIEPLPLQESYAVSAMRFQIEGDLSALPQRVESPLRNPRRPPEPPQNQALPLAPQERNSAPSSYQPAISGGRFGSFRSLRPTLSTRKRTDSFGKNVFRTVSLKHATNKKADQDLDPKLNPMWRPRAFWDDTETDKTNRLQSSGDDRAIVQNSLGLPHDRKVVTGPMELMRRFSSRRHNQKKPLTKQLSYGSLHRLQTGRRLYKIPGLGLRLQIKGLRDMQESYLQARRRRDDRRREQRQEGLRRSIGPNVISTGDSRFPASREASNDPSTPTAAIRNATILQA